MTDRFSYSSYSSQFLENRRLFWGSVLWHYGIVPSWASTSSPFSSPACGAR
jgi:nitrate reductase gamma subunit